MNNYLGLTIAIFLLTLGITQFSATYGQLWAASWVGSNRLLGYGVAGGLMVCGAVILSRQLPVAWWVVLGLTLLLAPVSLGFSLLAGSLIAPPPHPDRLFETTHPVHGGCQRVAIPDGEHQIPGLLMTPLTAYHAAVCIIPGAGDSKTYFKWRLVEALLAQGFLVLTIDPPGHGDDNQRPMSYPTCLTIVPATIRFLRRQAGVRRVGLLGISLGGALTINALADCSPTCRVEALVIIGTPTHLIFDRRVYYREIWQTIRAPTLSLLREISLRQIRQSWLAGRFHSLHSVTTLFELFNPLENITHLPVNQSILLIYGQRDTIAPPWMGRELHQAVPTAKLVESKKASHLTLTLLEETNQQVAEWLTKTLGEGHSTT